jgi:hypothetical protein
MFTNRNPIRLQPACLPPYGQLNKTDQGSSRFFEKRLAARAAQKTSVTFRSILVYVESPDSI